MQNAFMAILVELKLISEEDAKELIEKLKFSMLPGDFESSLELIRRFFNEIERDRPID